MISPDSTAALTAHLGSLICKEATPHIHRVLSQIKASGLKAEVVLNPGTPVMAAAEILPLVDQVLIMTVDPGFGGQAFIPETVAKVAGPQRYQLLLVLSQ